MDKDCFGLSNSSPPMGSKPDAAPALRVIGFVSSSELSPRSASSCVAARYAGDVRAETVGSSTTVDVGCGDKSIADIPRAEPDRARVAAAATAWPKSVRTGVVIAAQSRSWRACAGLEGEPACRDSTAGPAPDELEPPAGGNAEAAIHGASRTMAQSDPSLSLSDEDASPPLELLKTCTAGDMEWKNAPPVERQARNAGGKEPPEPPAGAIPPSSLAGGIPSSASTESS
mmetsp:Transcript_10088/g.29318  ORF Transcript_10088/g.29318 Transcript_10088/m.29318 type:complete len:229 (+) Transcript_10088:438-1124(+)